MFWSLILLGILSLCFDFIIYDKKYRKIIIFFIVGMSLFCLIPYLVDCFSVDGRIFFEKDIVKFWTDYLGDILGPLIALFGIWLENLKKEKRKEIREKKNLVESLKYDLDINLEEKNEKYKILSVLNFTREISYKGELEGIHSFENVNFKEYRINILNLDFGKDVLGLNRRIESFNKEWLFLYKNSKNRMELIKQIKKSINEKDKNIIRVIEDISSAIFCYTSFSLIERNAETVKNYIERLNNNINHIENNEELEKKLKDKGKYNFSHQNKETMLFLLDLLKESTKLLSDISFNDTELTDDAKKLFEEKRCEFYEYCSSMIKIISIDIFKIYEDIKNLNSSLEKELNRL